jgi:transposase
MSLKPQPLRPIAESVRRTCEQLLDEKDPLRIIGDRLSDFVRDEDFADLYASEGRPAISPAVLVGVTLLQFLENLSDRAATRMVRMRLDWKYALHLPLTYAGFDPSVLSDFRDRLERREGEGARRVLDKLLARLKEIGMLRAHGTQRTDSLSVLGAVRDLTRLELAMESVRLALRALQDDAEGLAWLLASFLAERLDEWSERYAHWTQEERLVREGGEAGRREAARLAAVSGEDARTLLKALQEPTTPARLRTLPAVVVLASMFEQQYEVSDEAVRWRDKVQVSGEQTLQTPHDPDVRWSCKRGEGWRGFKLQVTETVEEDLPRVITDVHTHSACGNDSQQLSGIHERLQERGLLPQTHLADTTYISGENMAESEQRGVYLLGPAYPDTSAQARLEGGVTQEQFEVDYERQQVRCPGGAVSKQWLLAREHGVVRGVQIAFDAKDCAGCALYSRCVMSKSMAPVGRRLLLVNHRERIMQRRQEQRTPEFRQQYRKRSGVEASLSEGVRAHGLRRARYVGLVRVSVQHLLTAASINLKRVARWVAGLKREEQRAAGLPGLCQAGPAVAGAGG